MNVKPKFVYYDIRRKQSVCLIMYTHENDVDTQVLEVSMIDNGEPIELSADYTYSAAIVNRNTKALINDSISCELNDSGNVLIPIDNFHTLGAQDLLIELTITDSAGNQVLVNPFPLWIHVNASILDDAEVTPESLGTVPELLEEAKEALENAGDYENLDNKPQINGHELVGDKSSDDLGLQDKLTAGENVTIDENGRISATGGVTSYTELSDKPQIHYRETYNPNVFHTVELTMPLRLTDSIRADLVPNGAREELLLDVANTAAFWYYTDLNGMFDLDSIGVSAPNRYNGYQTGRKAGISNLPDFVNASNNSIIQVLNYGFYNGYRLQFMSWIDSTTNTSKFAYRYVGEGRLVASKNNWKELSPTITSATVNQNGTITITLTDGSTITSTGATLENAANKVTSINSSSTNTQYPSAKAVYDAIQGVSNYTLTEQDKQDIADIVIQRLNNQS